MAGEEGQQGGRDQGRRGGRGGGATGEKGRQGRRGGRVGGRRGRREEGQQGRRRGGTDPALIPRPNPQCVPNFATSLQKPTVNQGFSLVKLLGRNGGRGGSGGSSTTSSTTSPGAFQPCDVASKTDHAPGGKVWSGLRLLRGPSPRLTF